MLTATVITHNEERNIERCLNSLIGVVDEIIVVDANSTDATVDICLRYGAKVTRRPFSGYGSQRQYASGLAGGRYVLSIDADEVLTEELRDSIAEAKNKGFAHRTYCFKVVNYVNGQAVHRSGMEPKMQTRLFDRRYVSWDLLDVGERPSSRFRSSRSIRITSYLSSCLCGSFYYLRRGNFFRLQKPAVPILRPKDPDPAPLHGDAQAFGQLLIADLIPIISSQNFPVLFIQFRRKRIPQRGKIHIVFSLVRHIPIGQGFSSSALPQGVSHQVSQGNEQIAAGRTVVFPNHGSLGQKEQEYLMGEILRLFHGKARPHSGGYHLGRILQIQAVNPIFQRFQSRHLLLGFIIA